MKADTPANIPASIANAKDGLVAISARIVPPAGIDLYNEFVNDVPMINKMGMATMSPIELSVSGGLSHDRTNLSVAIEGYLLTKEARGRSEDTISDYKVSMRQLGVIWHYF